MKICLIFFEEVEITEMRAPPQNVNINKEARFDSWRLTSPKTKVLENVENEKNLKVDETARKHRKVISLQRIPGKVVISI